MSNEYRRHLERISKLEVPEIRIEEGRDNYAKQCLLYWRIRKLAKDALAGYVNREFAVNRLKGLLKEVGVNIFK